ncbi:MAG: hypothetical protein KC635_27195, partial [Myxococcales bacterium]|nr:hypothetical protein [Myxococcales bacterium]
MVVAAGCVVDVEARRLGGVADAEDTASAASDASGDTIAPEVHLPGDPGSALGGDPGPAALVATPADVGLDVVPLGQSASVAVTLANVSTEAVAVSGVTVTGDGWDVDAVGLPAALGPGEAAAFAVSYRS